jgi:hypothetical protein
MPEDPKSMVPYLVAIQKSLLLFSGEFRTLSDLRMEKRSSDFFQSMGPLDTNPAKPEDFDEKFLDLMD